MRMSLPNYWKLVLIVILGILSASLVLLGVRIGNLYPIIAGFLVFAVFIIAIVLSVVLFVVDRKFPDERNKFRRGIGTTLFIVSSLSILLFFYYLVSLYPDALQFMKEGATAAVSAIIGGLIVESIVRLERNKDIIPETPQTTEPDTTTQMSTVEETTHENQTEILTEIRNILRDTGGENRELSYGMFILSWVVAVATLLLIGNEIWRAYGWPLPILWITTPCLMFGGMWFFFSVFKKYHIIWYIVGVVIIGIIAILLALVSSGVTIQSSTTGNVTTICENCSYPVTNTVNNYNVTVIENCTASKNPMVSVEELKYLMGSER